MRRQHIQIGRDDWDIYVYYNPTRSDAIKIAEVLFDLGCPKKSIISSLRVVTRQYNTGMTFSNTRRRTSVVCIGNALSVEQFMNTVVHEAKHVQSHICGYYGIPEDGENAAYLIGHIVQRMYKYINRYGGL